MIFIEKLVFFGKKLFDNRSWNDHENSEEIRSKFTKISNLKIQITRFKILINIFPYHQEAYRHTTINENFIDDV